MFIADFFVYLCSYFYLNFKACYWNNWWFIRLFWLKVCSNRNITCFVCNLRIMFRLFFIIDLRFLSVFFNSYPLVVVKIIIGYHFCFRLIYFTWLLDKLNFFLFSFHYLHVLSLVIIFSIFCLSALPFCGKVISDGSLCVLAVLSENSCLFTWSKYV